MKKFPVFFLFLALIAGFAAADDIGLSAGLEFGIIGVNDDPIGPYLDVIVGYENSFLDEALDISASLLYDFDLTKDADPDGKIPQFMSLDFVASYHLGVGDSSTLSLILEDQNDFILVPKVNDAVLGIIKPGIGFNQGLDIGDLYAQLDFPILYAYYGLEKNHTYSGLDITLGWASAFGLGLEAGGHVLLSPSDKFGNETLSGFTGLSFTASYESGPIYADIAATFTLKNKEFAPYSYFDTLAGSGVSITPSFSYSFDFGLTAYVYCIFDGIGLDGDVGITPAIGFTYSF